MIIIQTTANLDQLSLMDQVQTAVTSQSRRFFVVAMDGENRQPNVQDLKTLISADLNENLSKVLKIAIISVTFTACFHERDFLKDDHVNPLIHSDPHQLIKTVKAVSPLPLLSDKLPAFTIIKTLAKLQLVSTKDI